MKVSSIGTADVLALAGPLLVAQGGQGRRWRRSRPQVLSAMIEAGGRNGVDRVDHAGEAAGAAGRLDQVVEGLAPGVRPFGGVAHGLDIDDVGLERRHGLVGEAEAGRRASGRMLWMKMSAVLISRRRARRPASVFRSSATERLLRLRATNIGPMVRELGRLAIAALAIAGGLLDLDDVGAQVAQGLGGVGSEHELGQVDHPHAVQRSGA